MATVYVQLNGFSAREAHVVAWEAREAVGLAGGWVLEANLMSNKSLIIQFEMHARDVADLAVRLQAGAVMLDERSRRRAEELSAAAMGNDESSSPTQAAGTLQVTLTGGGADVRRVVPAVPG